MAFLVTYEDRFGRVVHAPCSDPQRLLDLSVVQGHLTAKKRKEARVMCLGPEVS